MPSRIQRAWSYLSKAAAPDQPSSTSLALQAQQVAQNLQNGPGSSVSTPPNVATAMVEQGMVQGGPFSPGQPIQQFMPQGTQPRELDFRTGYNIGARPRSNEGRVSFQTIDSIIKAWDVARICIEHIQDDVRSLEWRIVSSEEAAEDDVSADIVKARKFMSKPDGITPFDSWQNKFMEDILRYDAGCLFKQRLRGGDVVGLEVVQGTTVAPLLDDRGGVPRPPAPAYVQFAQGVPWVWMTTDDLVYNPFRPQPESPYGLPPLEWLLLVANTDIRFQWHFLQYFTAGTLPEALMEAPPDTSDPESVKRLQNAWDAVMEGDQSQKHKVKWIPHGSNPHVLGEKTFDSTFPLYLMRKACAAYKVTPNDIGFTDDVNRATADTQVDVQFRIGTMPRIRHLEGIYNRFLQDDLKLRVKFQFDTGGEEVDRLAEAQTHQVWVNMGAESVDEVRENVLGLPVDTAAPIPRFIFSPQHGAIPLKSILEIAGENDPETKEPVSGTVQPLQFTGPVDAVGTTPTPNDANAVRGFKVAPAGPDIPPPAAPAAPAGSAQNAGTAASATATPPAQATATPPAQATAATGAQTVAPGGQTASPVTIHITGGVTGGAAVQKELSRWRENSRKRVRNGRLPRPFQSEILTPELHRQVWGELQKAVNLAQVDQVFEAVSEEGDARLRVALRLQDAIAAELASRAL